MCLNIFLIDPEVIFESDFRIVFADGLGNVIDEKLNHRMITVVIFTIGRYFNRVHNFIINHADIDQVAARLVRPVDFDKIVSYRVRTVGTVLV